MTDNQPKRRRTAAVVVVLTVLIGVGMTVGFAGGSAVVSEHDRSDDAGQQNQSDDAGQHDGSDAGEDGAEAPTGEQQHQQKTVTAEGVEISEVRLENLRVSGLTVDVDRYRNDGREAALEDALNDAMGANVEGLEVECVQFGNISSADITVEDDVATVDAQVESVTIKGISAERVTMGQDGAPANGTQSDVVGSMMQNASLDADRAVVEGISIDRVVVERVDEGPQETPTDNVTETPDDNETETPDQNETETPDDNVTETPDNVTETPDNVTETPDNVTETPTDNETETPDDNVTETPDNVTETPGDNETENDSDVPVFEPPGDNETETPDENETDTEPSASVQFEDQTSNGTVVTVDQVNTSDGGFVAIHDESLLEGDVFDSVVGVTQYLEPGEHENVSAELYNVSGAEFNETELGEDQLLIAMPHQDTNDDQTYDFVAVNGEADGPYTDENGDAVVDVANVTVEDGAGDESPDENETDTEPSASVQFEDQTSNGTVVTVDQVNTSDGGYVAIHDESLLEGDVFGSVVGVSEYLEPGEHENVSAELYNVSGADFDQTELEEDQTLIAMPHHETNDNRNYDFVATDGEADGPYIDENNDAVVDTANVTVDGSVDGNETNSSASLGLAS